MEASRNIKRLFPTILLSFFFFHGTPVLKAKEKIIHLTENPHKTPNPFLSPYYSYIDFITSPSYKYVELNLPKTISKYKSPTLYYFKLHPSFKKRVEYDYIDKINTIGIPFLEKLFNDCVNKEYQYANTHFAFYHGQKREFLLFQDVAIALYKTFHTNIKNFIPLRIPDKDFKKFKNVQEFLHTYKHDMNIGTRFDHQRHISKILLPVNPSLFNNTHVTSGEGTFYFFMKSNNVQSINHIQLIKYLFTYFNISPLFKKYEKDFTELIRLLSSYETDQTGILIQILIPKTQIDRIAYRCHPYGIAYHKDHALNPPSYDLQKYQNNVPDLLYNPCDTAAMQFRLLINDLYLLKTKQPKHSANRIHMFRYIHETQKVKSYKRKLKNIMSKLKHDLQKKNTIHSIYDMVMGAV